MRWPSLLEWERWWARVALSLGGTVLYIDRPFDWALDYEATVSTAVETGPGDVVVVGWADNETTDER